MADLITAQGLLALLREDRRHRAELAKKRPVPFFSIQHPNELGTLEWDNSLPAVSGRSLPPVLRKASRAQQNLLSRYPFLGVPTVLAGDQLFPAGSAVLSAFASSCRFDPSDVDLFFVKGDKSADDVVAKFLRELREFAYQNQIALLLEDAIGWLKEAIDAEDKSLGLTEDAIRAFLDDLNEVQEQKRPITGAPGESFEEYAVSTGHFDLVAVGYETYLVPAVRAPDGQLAKSASARQAWREFVTSRSEPVHRTNVPTFDCSRSSNAIGIETTLRVAGNSGGPQLRQKTFKVQIILRVYDRLEHVVWGFDLGSSAVAIRMATDAKDARIVLSPMGKFALLTGKNVVDTTRLSPPFAARLRKYWERGFGFILPFLNLAALPQTNLKHCRKQVVELPHLTLEVVYIFGQEIRVGEFLCGWGRGEDYGPESDLFSVVRHNLKVLQDGGNNYMTFLKMTEDPTDILTAPPTLQTSRIQRFFKSLEPEIWNRGKLNLSLFKTHVGGGRCISAFSEMTGVERAETIKSCLEDCAARMVGLWEKVRKDPAYRRVRWMTEHPASQQRNYLHSGSVRPEFVEPAEWYGDYYLDIKTDEERGLLDEDLLGDLTLGGTGYTRFVSAHEKAPSCDGEV